MRAYIRYIAVIINFILGYLHLYRRLIQNCISDKQNIENETITFCVYVIVALFSIILFYPEIRFGLHHTTKDTLREILNLTVLALICSAGFVFVCSLLGLEYLPSDVTSNDAFAIIIPIILSPVYEEILCRGVIFRLGLNSTKNVIFAIAISTLIFSIFYIDIYAQRISQELINTGVFLCLGLFCGISYYKTNNIIYPIGIHMLWNFFMIISKIVFFFSK